MKPTVLIDDRECACLGVASLVAGCCVRTWSLDSIVRNPCTKTLESIVPPGAVGGLYGSGCFHFSSSFSVSMNRTCPSLSAIMPRCECQDNTDSLSSRVVNVSVGFE